MLTQLVLFVCVVTAIDYNKGSSTLTLSEETNVVVDLYGPGMDGNEVTGGTSGGFIRAIIFTDELNIDITQTETRVYGNNFELKALLGGEVLTTVGDDDQVVISQSGNPGSSKVCVGGRCNIKQCLEGCQGRSTSQQILSGSGGLAPYYLSLDGTVLDNPDYIRGDRYLDKVYTTNLLNCCGNNIKCATECVNGVDGSYGNGGSSAINFDGGSCDGKNYTATHCVGGKGGSGYVKLSYETDAEVDEINHFTTALLTIAIILIVFVAMLLALLAIAATVNGLHFRIRTLMRQQDVVNDEDL